MWTKCRAAAGYFRQRSPIRYLKQNLIAPSGCKTQIKNFAGLFLTGTSNLRAAPAGAVSFVRPRFLTNEARYAISNNLDRGFDRRHGRAGQREQSSPPRGVRIITPYSEHIYQGPQQLPDDEALRQQNVEGWRRFQMDMARRQQDEWTAIRGDWRLHLARSSPAPHRSQVRRRSARCESPEDMHWGKAEAGSGINNSKLSTARLSTDLISTRSARHQRLAAHTTGQSKTSGRSVESAAMSEGNDPDPDSWDLPHGRGAFQ